MLASRKNDRHFWEEKKKKADKKEGGFCLFHFVFLITLCMFRTERTPTNTVFTPTVALCPPKPWSQCLRLSHTISLYINNQPGKHMWPAHVSASGSLLGQCTSIASNHLSAPGDPYVGRHTSIALTSQIMISVWLMRKLRYEDVWILRISSNCKHLKHRASNLEQLVCAYL